MSVDADDIKMNRDDVKRMKEQFGDIDLFVEKALDSSRPERFWRYVRQPECILHSFMSPDNFITAATMVKRKDRIYKLLTEYRNVASVSRVCVASYRYQVFWYLSIYARLGLSDLNHMFLNIDRDGFLINYSIIRQDLCDWHIKIVLAHPKFEKMRRGIYNCTLICKEFIYTWPSYCNHDVRERIVKAIVSKYESSP